MILLLGLETNAAAGIGHPTRHGRINEPSRALSAINFIQDLFNGYPGLTPFSWQSEKKCQNYCYLSYLFMTPFPDFP
jgi:hypothetical protein